MTDRPVNGSNPPPSVINETRTILALRRQAAQANGRAAALETVLRNLNAVAFLALGGEKGELTVDGAAFDTAMMKANEEFTIHIRRESETSKVVVKIKTLEEAGLTVPKADA